MPIDPALLTLDALERDPFPAFAALRRTAPVAYLDGHGEWLVTSWDDCVAVAGLGDAIRAGHPSDDAFFGAPNVLRIEGAEHRGLRTGIDARLRPRAVNATIAAAARPAIVEAVERIRPAGRADLTVELFERISVRVVGDQLGLRDIDEATLVRWFHTLSTGLVHGLDDAATDAAAASLREIDEQLGERIERLRVEPDDSIMSHMLHGGIEPGAQPRTAAEVMPSIRVIILGGFQEPGHAMANTMLGLFSRPDQLAAFVADPAALVGPALQEGLRWIAPIGLVARQAVREVDYAGHRFAAGDRIQLAVSSANRDESRYERPEKYDLSRMLLPNATFGYGEHYCAGHFLARAVAQLALEETVRRLPGLRPDPELEPEVFGYVFRGAKHLPAVWDA